MQGDYYRQWHQSFLFLFLQAAGIQVQLVSSRCQACAQLTQQGTLGTQPIDVSWPDDAKRGE